MVPRGLIIKILVLRTDQGILWCWGCYLRVKRYGPGVLLTACAHLSTLRLFTTWPGTPVTPLFGETPTLSSGNTAGLPWQKKIGDYLVCVHPFQKANFQNPFIHLQHCAKKTLKNRWRKHHCTYFGVLIFLNGPFYFSTKQQRFYCCMGAVLMASLERSDQGLFHLQILEAAHWLWHSQLPWWHKEPRKALWSSAHWWGDLPKHSSACWGFNLGQEFFKTVWTGRAMGQGDTRDKIKTNRSTLSKSKLWVDFLPVIATV